MPCPHCGSDRTQEQAKTTSLGYRTFRCPACKRRFKERTGPPFTDLWVPTDIVFRVVLWRLRYPLSLRDLAEMFLPAASTSATRRCGSGKRWLRRKRRGKAGRKWHCDETYVKIQGVWCYLYRAIDADGNLVDSMLSIHRDMDAAKRFFAQSREVVGHGPERVTTVTTDGHDAYPRAIRETLGPEVDHRCSRYLNNVIEQDHRGIKGRYGPMRGFGSVVGAARFCAAYEEVRDYFRPRTTLNEVVPLRVQREQFCARFTALRALVPAA